MCGKSASMGECGHLLAGHWRYCNNRTPHQEALGQLCTDGQRYGKDEHELYRRFDGVQEDFCCSDECCASILRDMYRHRHFMAEDRVAAQRDRHDRRAEGLSRDLLLLDRKIGEEESVHENCSVLRYAYYMPGPSR